MVNFLLTNSLLKHEIFKFREIAKLFFQKSHQIVVGQAFFQNCLETLKKKLLCVHNSFRKKTGHAAISLILKDQPNLEQQISQKKINH